MKFLLVLVGALCLGTVIKAQSTVSTNVANSVTNGLTAVDDKIATIKASISNSDTAIVKSWSKWVNKLITSLSSQVNRFVKYPSSVSSQLSSLNNTIAQLRNMLNTSGPSMLLAQSSLVSLYSTIYQMAEQTGIILNAAAVNMTNQAIPSNAYAATCLQKYGAQLTAKPIVMSRFSSCLAGENARIRSIGSDINKQISNSLAMAQTFIELLSICNVPTAAELSKSWPQYVPKTECLNSYLTQIGSQSQVLSLNYIVDVIQYNQVQMVVFRCNRCAMLASNDIQDAVARTQAAFSKCLVTGK